LIFALLLLLLLLQAAAVAETVVDLVPAADDGHGDGQDLTDLVVAQPDVG